MSIEKQIEEMAKVMCGGCANGKECMQCLCADWYRAEKLYDADYRKQSEWISVEDRLPDNHRRVLIACDGTTIGGAAPIAIGLYGGGFWSIADADGTAHLTKYMHVVVTHWMPLPEPPKMKGGAE
jgi:hypothetical protein